MTPVAKRICVVRGMSVDDGFPLVQSLENRVELPIAEISVCVTGEQADAIQFQFIQGIVDLLDGVPGIVHGHRGERSVACRPARDEIGGKFVASPSHLAGFRGREKVDSGEGHGGDRRLDIVGVHQVNA